jgi:hypothetical protein
MPNGVPCGSASTRLRRRPPARGWGRGQESSTGRSPSRSRAMPPAEESAGTGMEGEPFPTAGLDGLRGGLSSRPPSTGSHPLHHRPRQSRADAAHDVQVVRTVACMFDWHGRRRRPLPSAHQSVCPDRQETAPAIPNRIRTVVGLHQGLPYRVRCLNLMRSVDRSVQCAGRGAAWLIRNGAMTPRTTGPWGGRGSWWRSLRIARWWRSGSLLSLSSAWASSWLS